MKKMITYAMRLAMLILVFCAFEANAVTEKYRLSLRDDPSTTIVIGWNQVSGTSPIVYYGTTDFGTNWSSYPNNHGVDRSVSHKGMDNRFSRLTGLTPNTVYYFVIRDSDGTSARYSFRTLPNVPTERLSIIAGGDSRNNITPRRNANMLVAKLRPHAVMFGGDYTDGNTDSEWNDWFDDWQYTIATDGRMTQIIGARGNHESNNADVVNLFDVPDPNVYYGLTLGGSLLRVYTLNTETSITGNQTTWLNNDLQANQSILWRFAHYHKPMRPHTSSKVEGNTQYNSWAGLFETYKVKLIVECDAHTVKTTYPVVPSTSSGSDEGFIRDDINGSVYVGEGCWGAPLRSNNDTKTWTRNSGQFNHVNWIFVDQNNVETRKIKVDNAPSVGSNTDATRFNFPSAIDVWNPSNGSVITISNTPSNLPPVVSITAPTNGTVYPSPQQITIDATASDPDGTVSSVEFYQNGTLIGTDNTSPFSINWSIPANGTYSLTARGIDNQGGAAYSSAVTISSGSNFTFKKGIDSGGDDVEEEDNGTMYTNSSDLELVADGGRGNQTIGLRFTGVSIPQGATINNAYIQFTCDETSSGGTSLTIRGHDVDNSPTFGTSNNDVSSRTTTSASVSWNPPAWSSVGESGTGQATPDIKAVIAEIVSRTNWASGNAMSLIITGSGERTAEAYEGNAGQAAELVVDYSVGGSSNTPPVVSITSPADNANYGSLATIAVNASATDADGIASVKFYMNGTLVATDNSAPYSVNWTIPSYGTHTISAEAEDNLGATATTTIQISAAVQANQPPTIILHSPQGGVNYPTVQSINIAANASDADGTVSQVDFYQNNVFIGTDNTAPYSINWNIPAVGNYSLTARAVDNDGAATFSAPVNISCGASFSFSKQIATGNDDAEEGVSGAMYLNSSDIELVYDSYNSQGDQTVGLRFTGISVPNGAFISNAYLQFTVDETSSGTTNLQILGEAADNSAAFFSSTGNISARSNTSASVAWSPASWNSVGDRGAAQQSPNIASVVSEIVSRPGWSSGNAMTIILTGTGARTAESYDGSSSQAAELVIEYSFQTPNQLPQVVINNPQNNTTFTSLGTINIDATATDSDGTISHVKFYQNGNLISQDNTAPYSTNFLISSYGSYSLTAEAIDNDGAVASDVIQISVMAPNQSPVAAFTSSATSGAAPLAVSFNAGASSDPDGTVTSYAWDFGNGTTGTGVNTSATYTAPGTYTVSLTVTDNQGASSSAVTETIVVSVPNSAPTVNITGPQDGVNYPTPQQITLTANANDVDGSVSQVSFYQNNNLIGTDNAAPYSINWLIPSVGSYALTAVAIDNDGASTTSSTVNITCGSSFTFNGQIASGNDDAEEGVSGAMYLNSSDIELVYDSYNSQGDQTVGLRFTNVTVPNGAYISNAYIQFTVDETSSGGTSVSIKGDDTDNSAPFSTNTGNISSRSITTASVGWAPNSWTSVGQSGTDQRSPNIGAVISEITARPGWSSGNALTLIITGSGQRTAESYDGSSSSAAQLIIEYSPVAPNNAPQVAIVAPSTNTTIVGLNSITIDANASDVDGTISHVNFYENGNLIAQDNTAPYSANFSVLSYGSYSLTAEAVDDDGAIATDMVQVSVVAPNQIPVAAFTSSTTSGAAPLSVTLDASASSDPDGMVTGYAWDFGDGTTGTGTNPSVTYFTPGTYIISLTVTDNQGASSYPVTETIVVSIPNSAPTASLSATPNSGQAPLLVSFDATQSIDGDGTIVDYYWNFGDGAAPVNGTLATHGTQTHTYTTAGNFVASLVVTDNDGATDMATFNVNVSGANIPPTAMASASPSSGQSPLNVVFDASGSVDPDGTIVSYTWDFGDGNSASSANPSHVYSPSIATSYTATLTITDNEGATSTSTASIAVGAPNIAPQAAYTATPISGAAPLLTTFDASASQDQDGSIMSYDWDFGDGTFGNGVNPSHSYTSAGQYTVSLTVIDNQGASNTVATSTINVNPAPPATSILAFGKVSGVGNTWQTVTLSGSYTNMVIVATPVYSNNNLDPVVTRIRNAGNNSFEVRVQNPGGTTFDTYDVEYLVAEAGVYTQQNDGIDMEARIVSSTSTARKNGWVFETHNYQGSFNTPVVLGQVMTTNDADWSVFWASRYNSRTAIPTAGSSGYAAGKHVGEDVNTGRANEDIGIIILEAGSGTWDSKLFETGYTNDFVRGTDNNSTGYAYSLGIDADHAVLSSSAMDGGDGGWPVIATNTGSTGTSLKIWIDEDQISNSERKHTTEQVAYFVVGDPPASTKTGNGISGNATDHVGYSEIAQVVIELYPNPTNKSFNFSFSETVGEQVDAEIIDLYGRVVYSSKVEIIGQKSAGSIDVSNMPAGSYIVRLKNERFNSQANLVIIN